MSKKLFYIVFYIMSVLLIASIWIPYYIEVDNINQINEEFYDNHDSSYDTLDEEKTIQLDIDGDGVSDNYDFCPDQYGTKENFGCPDSIEVFSDTSFQDIEPASGAAPIQEPTFLIITGYISDLFKDLNTIITALITIINIPVVLKHYRENKTKNEQT